MNIDETNGSGVGVALGDGSRNENESGACVNADVHICGREGYSKTRDTGASSRDDVSEGSGNIADDGGNVEGIGEEGGSVGDDEGSRRGSAWGSTLKRLFDDVIGIQAGVCEGKEA